MAKSNTTKRAEFIKHFGYLTVFADLKNIYFIHPKEGYVRTAEEQNELYKAGRSGCDGYEKKSMHQYDLARDIAILDASKKAIINDYGDHPHYETLGKFWKSLGHHWGGDFKKKDVFHFEY